MPRKARIESKSGIYHIMLRGINRQQIFEDDEDFEKFLWVMKDVKQLSRFKLYGYCLMGNHIHLLLKPENEPLELIFRRIGSKYVYWYNLKYQRTGHLFQDRFKSEPVESISSFFVVLRYIHQNPVKANICDNIENYKFSSYREYISDSFIVDKKYIHKYMTIEEFIEFNQQYNDDKCLDLDGAKSVRITDEQLRIFVYEFVSCKNVSDFQKLDYDKQRFCVNKLFECGASIRQMVRLLGMSKSTIEKWLKQGKTGDGSQSSSDEI